VNHNFACAWRLLAALEENAGIENNWINSYELDK